MNRLEREIAAVEQEFIAEGRQFTALDVGNQLKGKGINVRQRDVSPIVRGHFSYQGLYEGTGYTRVMIPVKDGEYEALLYLPQDSNPMNYKDTNQETRPYDPNKPMFPDQENQGPNITLVAIVAKTPGSSYVASRRSKVLHQPGCTYAGRIKPENLQGFNSLEM